MANKITINSNLIQDLKTYSTAVCVSLAAQVRDEMYEEARLAIDTFYGSYDPIYYKRHYDNFKNNSFKKYYKNPHGSIVRGGIELVNNLDSVYRADTEYIFSLVYSGYHGNAPMFPHQIHNIPPVMSPGPLEMLLDKRDSIVQSIDSYKGKAMGNASSKSYSVIRV